MKVAELLTSQTVFKNCCLLALLDCVHGGPIFSPGFSQSSLQPVCSLAIWHFVSCQIAWAWSSSPNTDLCSCLFFSELRTMSSFLFVAHRTLCALFLRGIWCPLSWKNKSVNLYFFFFCPVVSNSLIHKTCLLTFPGSLPCMKQTFS